MEELGEPNPGGGENHSPESKGNTKGREGVVFQLTSGEGAKRMREREESLN